MRNISTFILLLLATPFLLHAENCVNLWKHGMPNLPNYTSYPCKKFKEQTIDGHTFKIYHYLNNYQTNSSEISFFNAALEALTDAYPIYKNTIPHYASGDMPQATLIFVENPSPTQGYVELARTFDQHPVAGEACPIVVFRNATNGSFPGGLNINNFKQIIAHEYFHCVQYAFFKDQIYGPGDVSITNWWVEGTAEFFSNLVYPTNNFEFRNAKAYHPEIPIFDQPNHYATAAFFQELSTDVKPDEMSLFFKELPTSGSSTDQQIAVANFRMMGEWFHTFALNLKNHTIKDSGGGFFAIPSKTPNISMDVPEKESATITLKIKPFTVVMHTLKFAPNGHYTISLKKRTGAKGSYRLKGSHKFSPMLSFLPQHLDTSCKKQPTEIEYLITYAGDMPGEQDIELEISYEKIPCVCDQNEKPFDQCLVGQWLFNNKSIEQLAQDTFAHNTQDFTIYNRGIMKISASKQATLTLDDWTLDYKIDPGMGIEPIHVTNIINALITGQTGNVEKGILCLKNIGGTTKITTITEAAGHSGQSEVVHPSSGESQVLHYSCTQSTLTIKGKLPIGTGGSMQPYSLLLNRL